MDTVIPAAAAQVAALSTVATWTTNFSSFHLLLDRVEQQLFIACAELCDDYAIYVLFRFCVQPRHWGLEYRESDEYAIYVLFRFCVQPRHFLVDWNSGDDGASWHVFWRDFVSRQIYVYQCHHWSGELVCACVDAERR